MNRDPDLTPENDPFRKWLTGGWALSGAVIVLLVIAFYVEEDWRGEAYWKQAQAAITLQGESLDPSKFIPPPVPDEENFGALPIFRLEPESIPGYPSYLSTVALRQALAHVSQNIPSSKNDDLGSDQLPYLGNWWKGEKPDLPAIQKRLAELCHRELSATQAPPKATPADLFGLLYPALADLRAADATHPICRFEDDYKSQPPMDRSFGNITEQIRLAQVAGSNPEWTRDRHRLEELKELSKATGGEQRLDLSSIWKAPRSSGTTPLRRTVLIILLIVMLAEFLQTRLGLYLGA
jgi:hypothetical protein